MKGTEVAPYARWRGNPAHEIRDLAPMGSTAVTHAAVTHAIGAAPAITVAPPLRGGSAAPLLDITPRSADR